MESAKEANMPQENIKRAIQKGTGELPGESYEEITYEGYAPGGVAVLIQVLTDNRNRTGPEIRHAFEKYGGNMGSSGAVAWMFDRQRDHPGGRREDRRGRPAREGARCRRRPTCAGSKKFSRSRPRLMKWTRCATRSSGARCRCWRPRSTYVPQSTVRVEGKDAAAVLRLIEALEEQDDVQSVYANYDIPDEVIDAISAA